MGSEVYGNHCSARNGDTDHILVASVLGDGIAASYRRISDGGGGWGVELDSEREPGFSSEFMLMAFLISCDILITDSINILWQQPSPSGPTALDVLRDPKLGNTGRWCCLNPLFLSTWSPPLPTVTLLYFLSTSPNFGLTKLDTLYSPGESAKSFRFHWGSFCLAK